MRGWRYQAPVHSPLDVAAVAAAFLGGDPRALLADRLRGEFGAVRVHLLDSGTSALTLAILASLGPAAGGAIALPGYGCFDLATAALGAGATVRLYDVDPATLQPDLDSLRRVVAGGVRGVVVVHQYGVPVALDPIRELLRPTGALLIEDAAQGIGATWGDRPLGASGDVGILSFGRGKGWTGGEGGALLVHAALPLVDAMMERLPPADGGGVGSAIKLAAQWMLGRPTLYALPAAIPRLRLGETVYRDPSSPRRLGPAAARVLLRTREAARQESARRREHAERLLRSPRSDSISTIEAARGRGHPGWLRLPVLIRSGTPIDARAAARLGIRPGYPIALDALEALRPVLDGTERLTGARDLAARLWTLPTHRQLGERDLRALERWLLAGGQQA